MVDQNGSLNAGFVRNSSSVNALRNAIMSARSRSVMVKPLTKRFLVQLELLQFIV